MRTGSRDADCAATLSTPKENSGRRRVVATMPSTDWLLERIPLSATPAKAGRCGVASALPDAPDGVIE